MQKWTVVYYRGSPHPRSDYIENQPANEVALIDQKLDHMEITESHTWAWVDNLEDKLWEIKSGPHRLLYFLWFGHIVILHAARKRGRSLSGNHIERALRRMEDVKARYPNGF